MAILKQSTAYSRAILMVDSADHVTGKTGLTLTITASKAGGSFASISPTVTELATGWYKLALTTSHTDTLGDLALHITSTGADPTDICDQVTARILDDLAYPATSGRSMVVDASGLVDANAVKLGPSGSGTAQTARDIGTSVLLSSGTGTGQLSLSSGAVLLQATQTGVTIPTVTNLTNAPGAGDFTATMKTSIGTAVAASAVASVTGAVGSIGAGGITATSIASDAITAAKIADGAIDTATFASGTTIPRCTLTDTVTAVTGLTASNLDATISSRMATYAQPTGFLAATFPGTVASPTNITAGTITTVTNLTNAATAGDLTSTMKDSVNAQVVDALATDTYAEPGQGTPSATLSLSAKIGYLFKAFRNRSTQTSTAYNLYNDDAITVDQKATVSDDAVTFDRNEITSGP